MMAEISIQWNDMNSSSYISAKNERHPMPKHHLEIYGISGGVDIAHNVIRYDPELLSFDISRNSVLELTFRRELDMAGMRQYLKQLSGRIQNALEQADLSIRVVEHPNLFSYVDRAR